MARRRLGQTDLAVKAGQVGTSNSTKPKNLGEFDYAHLRAPLPKGIVSGIFRPSPQSYFLMRRSVDGYISATGMFKATFPYAEAEEEEAERKYIKSLDSTSTDETAGNVWIPPTHALELAEEYRILPWIKALLDNAPIEVNNSQKHSSPIPAKSITSPPPFLMPQDSLNITAPTPTRGRPRRAVSPSKIASPKKTTASTRGRKKADSVEPTTKQSNKSLQEALKSAAATVEDESTSEVKEEDDVKKENNEEPVVRVTVDTEVEVKDEVEITHTHVEVEMPAGKPQLPLPEDTEAIIAKAKEMVEAAVKSTGGASISSKKRKAEEVEEDDEENENEIAETAAPPAKKAKVEVALKKERVKTRALIGLSATLAIGYACSPRHLRLH